MTRVVAVIALMGLCLGCSRMESPTVNGAAAITPAAFNSAGAPTVSFSVPDMMCPEGCGEKVKEILSKQPGAKDVVVDFPNKTATVAIDKSTFDPQKAIAALKDCQFKNSVVKQN
jgi:copper chaperone CopZ